MNTTIETKLTFLKDILRNTGGCAIAYSGGVDSTLVLTVAREVLGDRCLAVIAVSSTYPEREFRHALTWVERNGIPHEVVISEELDIPEFAANPFNRCYHCKKELFTKVAETASHHGLAWIADGSNADDTGDYRPGLTAARECRVLSPLIEAGISKEEVRAISREVYQLPTADKPSMACLASRFPFGTEITLKKLGQVERIETMLDKEGFRIYRARHHGDILRLEFGPDEMEFMQDESVRRRVVQFAREQGFLYVTLDLEGYRTGSMNPVR